MCGRLGQFSSSFPTPVPGALLEHMLGAGWEAVLPSLLKEVQPGQLGFLLPAYTRVISRSSVVFFLFFSPQKRFWVVSHKSFSAELIGANNWRTRSPEQHELRVIFCDPLITEKIYIQLELLYSASYDFQVLIYLNTLYNSH
jgi:hypothetical protein